MAFVYIIIFLALIAVVGFFVYKNMFLEKNKVEHTFDAFIINAGFKWLNSADPEFMKVKHILGDSTMDISGYTIDILQMIYRDFGKFKMYVCDITLGAAKGPARISVNKTCLFLARHFDSKDKLEIHRHLPNIDDGQQVLITGADTISAGIYPTFGGIFTIKGILTDKNNPMLTEAAQKVMLSYQNKYPLNGAPGEARIYIDGNGMIIFGARAWEEEHLKTLVNLAREIVDAK